MIILQLWAVKYTARNRQMCAYLDCDKTTMRVYEMHEVCKVHHSAVQATCREQKGLWPGGSCMGYRVILEDHDKYYTFCQSSRAMPFVWFMSLFDPHLLSNYTGANVTAVLSERQKSNQRKKSVSRQKHWFGDENTWSENNLQHTGETNRFWDSV